MFFFSGASGTVFLRHLQTSSIQQPERKIQVLFDCFVSGLVYYFVSSSADGHTKKERTTFLVPICMMCSQRDPV